MDNQSKSALAESVYEKASRCEVDYGCCPQCVLKVIQETLGGVDDQTIKAAHGLSGGGGLTGEGTCGALVGGLMALSVKRGRDADKFHKGRFINNFARGRELVDKFRQEFNGVTCAELQRSFTGRNYNMWDAGEYAQFNQDRGMKCAHATGTVAKWVVEMW